MQRRVEGGYPIVVWFRSFHGSIVPRFDRVPSEMKLNSAHSTHFLWVVLCVCVCVSVFFTSAHRLYIFIVSCVCLICAACPEMRAAGGGPCWLASYAKFNTPKRKGNCFLRRFKAQFCPLRPMGERARPVRHHQGVVQFRA